MGRKFTSVLLVIAAVSVLICGCGKKREIVPLSDVTLIEQNKYSCTFDDVYHEFILCFPEDTKGAPLVLMLHGAGESAEAMKAATSFDETAVPEGYAVCYVTGAVDKGATSPIKGWNSGTVPGENNDTGFLVSLAAYLEEEYKLDKDRTFAVGFSYGAFMTYRLAVEAPDIFEATVSVAGVMPMTIWEERAEKADVGIFQISGSNDDIIPLREASAIAPSMEDVISYWAEADGLTLIGEEDIGKDSHITRYGADGKRAQVWDLVVSGGYHSWPLESITGIDTNALIIEFLETQ